ncbi:sensor histidine kinase [Nocardiopsis gilva]|uniref:sensor histidine kinase n=1 Tax=Nocardiopsis gilva TaxID=280236 RepID=UPI00034D1427|nr:ATP-binding protein [Nocardiopsis gilva]
MSAHAPADDPRPPSPGRLAGYVLLGATAAVALVWTWVTLAVPWSARAPVLVGGTATGAVLVAALAAAAYYAATARQARERTAHAEAATGRLEREALHLREVVLPTLAGRVGEGVPAESALAEVVQPTHGALRGLAEYTARTLDAAESRAVAGRNGLSTMEGEAAALADETLPALVARIRASRTSSAEAALAEVVRPTHHELSRVLEQTARALSEAERRGGAAMAGCASAAARVQAQVTTLLARLRELEDIYGDQEGIFADLLDLDHSVSQMGRLADSFALLSGGRSGRRWTKPIVMESVLRGAMGRISAYRRVRVHSTSTSAVAGYAAEGVMHAVAELMDNATTFSAHDTEVHVYVEEENTGVTVTIEDSGLGMRARERRRAEQFVSESMDLTTLSGTRLGLAVVGRLAAKYGLTVNFRPSSRGGSGAVVLIPQHLITQPRVGPAEPAPTPPPPAAAEPTPSRAGHQHAEPRDGGRPEGLPQRRRGETLAAAARSRRAPAAAPTTRERRDTGARFAAFRHASRGRGPSGTGEEERS